MVARRRERRTLKEAFEAGVLAGHLQYKAKRHQYGSHSKPLTFMQWLRKNALVLKMLGSVLAGVASGMWTVYTYYNPAPPAVTEPADSGGPIRRSPGETSGGSREPRDRPEDSFGPRIQLILFGAPLDHVPQPVQQSLQAAALIIHRTPEEQSRVEDNVLRLLTNLGYIPRDVSSVMVWQDWNTVAIVPVAKNPVSYQVAARTLTLTPAPRTFDPPPPSKPSDSERT